MGPVGGLALMAWGIAHLLCPTAFELVNRIAFKTTRAHMLINGSIEAGLG
jgi:hypothetical protein